MNDPGEGTEAVDTGEQVDTGEEGTEVLEGTEGLDEGNEAAPEVRKFRVKVDGEEIEVDEATLLRDYQLSKASHARMQQAAAVRQQAEDQIAQIRDLAAQTKQDPRALFNALGLDARAFAEALLTEELENELLLPDERELRDFRADKKRRESDSDAQKKKLEKEQAEALTQQAGDEIESEIVDALKASGLKATPRTVARVAELILASLEGEGPRMKASDALARLTPEYRADVAEMLEAQDPETLEREYPSLYKKILHHAANKKAPVPSFQKGVGNQKSSSRPTKPKTWDDWIKD